VAEQNGRRVLQMCTGEELKPIFSRFGDITLISINQTDEGDEGTMNVESRRGWALVTFQNEDAAVQAAETRREFSGSELEVERVDEGRVMRSSLWETMVVPDVHRLYAQLGGLHLLRVCDDVLFQIRRHRQEITDAVSDPGNRFHYVQGAERPVGQDVAMDEFVRPLLDAINVLSDVSLNEKIVEKSTKNAHLIWVTWAAGQALETDAESLQDFVELEILDDETPAFDMAQRAQTSLLHAASNFDTCLMQSDVVHSWGLDFEAHIYDKECAVAIELLDDESKTIQHWLHRLEGYFKQHEVDRR
jgi:hypothetical protein